MKNKILKTCLVGCLATCLTLTGIFAFAPLGASAQANSNNPNASLNNNLNNSTNNSENMASESTGLITPRANDPVLFRTESGLEIKWGNSGTLASGNLAGFPYFNTFQGSKGYTWVIIGSALDIWRNMNLGGPAGFAILNDNVFVKSEWVSIDLFSSFNPANELSDGEILCLANQIVDSGQYSTSASATAWGIYNSNNCIFYNYIHEAYLNDSFGLGNLKQKVIAKNINTQCWWTNVHYSSCANYFFVLGAGVETSENFKYSTYLTIEQFACNESFWGRSVHYSSGPKGRVINPDGAITECRTTDVYGYRPCFVLDLK